MPKPKKDYDKEPADYAEFRTGLTYSDVYQMIFKRKYKRRHGVLGAWREIKKRMYNAYLYDWYKHNQTEKDQT